MYTFITRLRVFTLACLITGASAAFAQDSISLPSIVAPRLVWPSNQIPVCWENTGTTYATEVRWVREAIAATWERHSPLRFTGWNSCQTGSMGIRIQIDDSNPRSYVGTQVNGRKNGMHLNFIFRSWSPSCANPAYREQCIKSIAVHEFGHAIGILHEHDRPDTPESCRDQYVTDPGALQFVREYGYLVGAYDSLSVMNYCAVSGPGFGMSLSPGDIAGVASLYGSTSKFLFCAVNGERNATCCRHLTTEESSKAAVCTSGREVPEDERLSYFRFCNASGGPRCCDHLTHFMASEHAPQQCPRGAAIAKAAKIFLEEFEKCVKDENYSRTAWFNSSRLELRSATPDNAAIIQTMYADCNGKGKEAKDKASQAGAVFRKNLGIR